MDALDGFTPIAFETLTREELPVDVEIFEEATGESLWSATITGAGALVVPGFAPTKVTCVITNRYGSFKTNSQGESFTLTPLGWTLND